MITRRASTCAIPCIPHSFISSITLTGINTILGNIPLTCDILGRGTSCGTVVSSINIIITTTGRLGWFCNRRSGCIHNLCMFTIQINIGVIYRVQLIRPAGTTVCGVIECDYIVTCHTCRTCARWNTNGSIKCSGCGGIASTTYVIPRITGI